MNALLSTTIVAVAVIAAASVAICLGKISSTDFVSLVGAFGGATGVLHIASSAGKT